MAEHKRWLSVGKDNRHPERVRPPGGNDERTKRAAKKSCPWMDFKFIIVFFWNQRCSFFLFISLISHKVQAYRVLHLISPPFYNLLPLEVYSNRLVSYSSECQIFEEVYSSLIQYRPASLTLHRLPCIARTSVLLLFHPIEKPALLFETAIVRHTQNNWITPHIYSLFCACWFVLISLALLFG